MSKQMKALAITMALSSGMFYSLSLRGAESQVPPALPLPEDGIQQLLRDRENAVAKALTAETKLREAGVSIDSMGFDSARTKRDQQLLAAMSGQEKLAAYEGYAKTARRLERKVQSEVEQGLRAVDFSDIARFARLQAEVELAQAEGRLMPARQEPAEIPSYEQALSALGSERRKLKAGKSELFVVHRLAEDVRDTELQMSSTASQRIAALARYAAQVRELEGDAVTALDRVLTQKWRQDAESDLNRAKLHEVKQ